MRKSALVALVLAAVTACGAFPAPAAAAPDPMSCTGYPQPRVFLESQSWWRGTPLGDAQVRHVHSGACFPYKQTLNGQVTIDVVTMLHEYQSWMLRYVRVQAASDQDGVKTLKTVEPRKVCTVADCTFVTPVTVDVSGLGAGIWEFRIHSEARPGIVSRPWNLATNGWLACVKSCTGRTPKAVDAWQTEGRGYYENSAGSTKGYINGRFLDPLPWNPATGQLEPKSGTWCPNVRTLQGAGDEPATHSFITLDPRFHAMPEDRGRVLLERTGTFRGPICIDTTQLTDGRHKLFVQTSWDGGPERLWGAIVIPFAVSNGAAPAPAPSPPACSNGRDDDGDGFTDYPGDAGCTEANDNDEANAVAPAPTGTTVQLTRPSQGQVVAGTTTLDAAASSDVVKVEYLVDGKVVAADDSAGNGFSEPWNTTTVANGSHTVVARGHTGTGGRSDSAPVGFTVKNAG